ncbi:MAG: TIGR04255 family protein [Candidatus Acidiferrales bacterium]
MSEPELRLRNPPIIEAVLDIECDLGPKFDIKAIETSCRNAFLDTYPKTRTQLMQGLALTMKPGEMVSQPMQSAIQAYQFLHDDEKQIVQARVTGYSFNRLAPYSSFDEYLPEIRRTWEIYRGIANPIQIGAVQLRYINRIYLPLTNGRVELNDYFRNGPQLPWERGLTFKGFLNQSTFEEDQTGHIATTVLTAQQPVDNKVPVIFDNAARAASTIEPTDWQTLKATLQSLRSLKNRVFINTLSNPCLSLFQ